MITFEEIIVIKLLNKANKANNDHRIIELKSGLPIKKVSTRILPLKYEMAENLSQEVV